MFEIFVAIFGSIYYACRTLEDRCATKSYEIRRSYDLKQFDNIKGNFEDYFQVGRKLYDLSTREAMLKSIESELNYVLGSDWRNKYSQSFGIGNNKNSDKYFTTFSTDRSGHPLWVARQLLLAREGKVYFEEFNHRLIGSSEMIDRQIKTFQIIEKEIQKKYPQYRINVSRTSQSGDAGQITWRFC